MKMETKDILYFGAVNIIALVLTLMSAGCATESRSVGLGAGAGAGVGAIAGGLADPGRDGQFRTRNVIIGTTLGGMVGAIAGSEIHKNQEEQKKEAFLKGRASAPSQSPGVMPTLTQPRVRTEWVDSHTVGNRYIDGHFEYVIEEPSRWDQEK
jgi:hypothetical protein